MKYYHLLSSPGAKITMPNELYQDTVDTVYRYTGIESDKVSESAKTQGNIDEPDEDIADLVERVRSNPKDKRMVDQLWMKTALNRAIARRDDPSYFNSKGFDYTKEKLELVLSLYANEES